jgi:hypothetical protein
VVTVAVEQMAFSLDFFQTGSVRHNNDDLPDLKYKSLNKLGQEDI